MCHLDFLHVFAIYRCFLSEHDVSLKYWMCPFTHWTEYSRLKTKQNKCRPKETHTTVCLLSMFSWSAYQGLLSKKRNKLLIFCIRLVLLIGSRENANLNYDKFSADQLQTSLPWWRKDGFSDTSVEVSQCQRDPSSEHVNKWSGLEGWKWTSHTGGIKSKSDKTISEQVSSIFLRVLWPA